MNFILPYLQSILNCVFFIVFILFAIALSTLVERKVMGSMQRRKGPNVVGIYGFLQPFADGVKLIFKQNIIPRDADLLLFLLAPIFTFFCSWKIWAAIPFDSIDIPVYTIYGVFYLLIVLSFGVYGIIFAGWSSNSKYAFLGGLRSTAQMISYEVCLSFIFLIVVLFSQSLDLKEIVYAQSNCWFVIPLLPVWLVFFVCTLAETNRAPFDLPEAEAELVAGYNVEYSAIPFALFFLGEYSNIIAMGALSSLFFFGGWLPLFGLSFIPGYVWFSTKVVLYVFSTVWVRATFPRYRYDQLMKLGWKLLLPVSLFFVLLINILFIHMDKYCSLFY